MPARALSKSKRFNEIFHILLEHRLAGLAKDIAALARAPAPVEPPPDVAATAVSANGAAPPHPVAVRLRRLMEDLGPTFIKIGQLLGTRPDLLPKEFIEEFKKMYDETPPTPFTDIRRVVEQETGRPLESVFRSFEQAPIASASIAQVHKAVLRTGEVVAVKVQHPGIEASIRTDFEILQGIVQFTERVFSATQVWQPVKHLEEVRHMLDKELDFRNEARIQAQVEANFIDVPEVKIPHVYPDVSTKRMLVMEFVQGAKFRNRTDLHLDADANANLARIITHAMAKQIFVDRLFHADPSPGNLLLLSKDGICILDFGAVGQVTRRRARLILDFITALAGGNLEETARVIVELCEVRKEYDPKQFLYDLERIIEYYETEHASPADPVLLEKIISLANRHGMLLPPDFMLITRALYQFDGMCKELDPDYELVKVLTPFVQRTLRDRLMSAPLQPDMFAAAAQDLAKLVTRLPTRLENLLVRFEKGQISTQIELHGLEEYKRHSATLTFLIGFTTLLAAVVIGGSLAYSLGGPAAFRVAASVGIVATLVWLLVVVVLRQGLQRRR